MDTETSTPPPDSAPAKAKTVAQLVWGVALALAGIGVFFRIPQVMPKIEKMEQFSSGLPFIRFCFYLLGVLLIVGGAKKIYGNYRKVEDKNPSP